MALTRLLARTGFNVPDQDDIDGLALDGDDVPAAAVGSFEIHPTSESTIAVRSSHATGLGTGDVDKYTIASVTDLDSAEHATEAVLRFPSFDTITPGSPCHSGDCAGEIPDRCPFTEEGTPLDDYTIWFEKPPLGNTAHLSVQTTLSTGTYVKAECDVLADGTANFYVTVTPAGSDTVTVGPHSLRPNHTLDDFCNGLGFSINGSGPEYTLTVFLSSLSSITVPVHASDLGSPSHSASGATLNAYGSSGSFVDAGDEVAYPEVTVRSDPTDETHYALGMAFRHDVGPDISSELQLYERVAGVQRLLKSFVVTALHDTPTAMKLEAPATNVLRALWGGVGAFTFNLLTDLAEEDGELATLIATGRPGLTATVVNPDWLAIEQVSVYGPEAPVPCEGGPENPYPWCGPPDPPQQPTYLYVRENAAWRAVLAPVPAVQVGDVHGRVSTGTRQASDLRIRWNLAWRSPAPDSFEGEPPPPETERPPFDDPCNLLPPVDPDPDGVPLDPISDRWFGMGNTPTSALGSLFTFTQRAAGSWTPGDVSACAAKASRIIVAQGSYDKFKVGGRWNFGKYADWAVATLEPLLPALTQPSSGLYSMMDDFSSSSFWGPGGIPIADLEDLYVLLKALLPGVLIGARALPSQFSSNPGFDFYTAQYVSWRGTAAQFRAREQGLAQGRSAYIILSLNYLHGGNGDSGIRITNGTMNSGKFCMSPAEVVAYGNALFTDGSNLIGSLGYQYGNPQFMGQPGILNALATIRNTLAAL